MATVRGKITLPDGSAASGIRLQGESRSSHYFRGYTMSRTDGTYEFHVYPRQAVMIAITDRDWATASHPGIDVEPGEVREGVDFSLTPGTLIHGTISVSDPPTPAPGDTVTLRYSDIDRNCWCNRIG
jgi:hypothetical protein